MYKRIHQGGDIICTMCPYKTDKPFSMKKHLAEIHGLGKVYQCNQCDYKIGGPVAKGHMKTHMARHSKEKNFQCDQCEYSSSTKEGLSRHFKVHEDGEPKYLCDKCDYKSNDSGNFKAHREVKHGSVILSCESCDYNTKSKRGLRDHKKKHSTNPVSLVD